MAKLGNTANMQFEVLKKNYCIKYFIKCKYRKSWRLLPKRKKAKCHHFIITGNDRRFWKVQMEKQISAANCTPDFSFFTHYSISPAIHWMNNCSSVHDSHSQLTVTISCPERKIINSSRTESWQFVLCENLFIIL